MGTIVVHNILRVSDIEGGAKLWWRTMFRQHCVRFTLSRKKLEFLHLPRHHDALKRYAYSRFLSTFPLNPGKQMLENIIVLNSLKMTLVVFAGYLPSTLKVHRRQLFNP